MIRALFLSTLLAGPAGAFERGRLGPRRSLAAKPGGGARCESPAIPITGAGPWTFLFARLRPGCEELREGRPLAPYLVFRDLARECPARVGTAAAALQRHWRARVDMFNHGQLYLRDVFARLVAAQPERCRELLADFREVSASNERRFHDAFERAAAPLYEACPAARKALASERAGCPDLGVYNADLSKPELAACAPKVGGETCVERTFVGLKDLPEMKLHFRNDVSCAQEREDTFSRVGYYWNAYPGRGLTAVEYAVDPSCGEVEDRGPVWERACSAFERDVRGRIERHRARCALRPGEKGIDPDPTAPP